MKVCRRVFVLMIIIFGMGVMRISQAQNQNPTQMVCPGVQGYHVDVHPNPTATYTWLLTGGGTILSGQGTNAIQVDWTTPGGPYTLSVFTTANGCIGLPKSVQVTVAEQPVGPTLLLKTPPEASVCAGTQVSANFTEGSGGVECSDEFEYSYDNSGTWTAYTEGTPIVTTGHTLVEIRGRRSGCNAAAGCNETPWETLASWTITPALPLVVTITPSANPVCEGTAATYSATVTNGGSSPQYVWRINGGTVVGTESSYTYIPANGDVITCEVLSSDSCAAPNPVTGSYTIVVEPLPNTSDIWHN